VTESGLTLQSDKIILCTGGTSRKLLVPGAELTATHSDAWALTSVPQSIIVIGGGATGAQVASVFNAFGSKIRLFQSGPRILPTEDEDVSRAVAAAFRESGIDVREDFGSIESFEKTPDGIRMHFSKNGERESAQATLAVLAIGWVANTSELELSKAGVEINARGFISIDEFLRTSASNIFAAGDVTGRLMLVPQAIQDGFVAATNAVRGPSMKLLDPPAPIGSFTDPEYAQVGLTETEAREKHGTRPPASISNPPHAMILMAERLFCKLIADRTTRRFSVAT
jgi:pyruvate/2-oxoglutarate dehydrogenase complex dihydrolipoamide dehydrogenase (E3) component